MHKFSAKEITNPSFPVYKVQIAGFRRFFITFGGAKLILPLTERVQGVREPETTEIFKACVGPGDMVLEGGACYGYMTMQLSQLVGKDGRVVAIEPSDTHRRLLRWTVQRNNIPNVAVRNWFMTDGRVFETDKKIAHSPTTLSRALKLARMKPDFIFLDIEGYEIPILWKALGDGLFDEKRPTIVFQPHYSFYGSTYPEKSFEKLWKAMTVFGYSLHRLEYLIVCLPEEADHAKQAAIRKLLHGGLQGTGTEAPEEAEGVRASQPD